MKKIILSGTLFFVFAVSISAQEDVSPSKWQENKIVIDGHISEWNPPFNLIDNKSGLIFSIANDHKYLYLCFTENEELKAEKLMKAGWSFELSSSEKKRKFTASVSFPKIEDPNINIHGDFTHQVSYYKMDLVSIKTKGFVSNNGDIPLLNTNGINIAIGAENEQKIIYEIAIPIKELMPEDKLQLNELITLDVTVNALAKSDGQSAAGNSSARSSFSGGRMGGGHMGGGRRGTSPQSDMSGSDRSSLLDKVGFTQKFRLVTK